MNILQNLSIRSKITTIIAGVSIIAIGLSFAVITLNSISSLKRELINQSSSTAKLLSQYLLYSLTFNDSRNAVETLNKLEAIKFVNDAEIFNEKGIFLASYQNKKASKKFLLYKKSTHKFVNDELWIYEPIIDKGDYLGTIFLKISTKSLNKKVHNFFIGLIFTGLTITIIIFLLANFLQNIISRPILQLAALTKKISETNDFSIRISTKSNDEICVLYRGFNNMLEQIIKRDIETYRVQQDLIESREQFSSFMEVLPAAAFIKNSDSSYHFVNQFLIDSFEANEWLGKKAVYSYNYTKNEEFSFDQHALKEVVHQNDFIYDKNQNLRQFETWKFPMKRPQKNILIGGISIEVTKRKKAEQKLQYYIHELERNNKELEEFNYVVSHDLREPLRTITSYCDLLNEDLGNNLNYDVKQDIDFIIDAATRMNLLIQDLLLLSRAGRIEFENVAVDLNLIFDNIIKDLKLKIDETQGQIIYKNIHTVKGDPIQLSRLFQNLFTNALKFKSDKVPIIEIRSKIINNQVQIEVKDNGIGIEEKYVDQIFSAFKRLHPRDKYEGTGIGLAICKKIVERHNGSIKIKSEIGKGSIFIVTLTQFK